MKNLIAFVLFIFAFGSIAEAQVSTLEKNALIDLYKSTKGDSWNTTWNLTSQVNTWHGVTVENNKVIALNLSMNNLNGTIPSSIKNLSNLKGNF